MKDLLAGNIPAADYAFILNACELHPPKVSQDEMRARQIARMMDVVRMFRLHGLL